ncbi:MULTISPECIES: hypothetical protein [Methylocaldum]|jgi:hypothetical protein|uniref:hypothetical protein n=1 Tax=unclassified Methylocaldum TaxID=2622260 RepID=UPI000989AEB7|nr:MULTISPECIES: hypothetical protein [unclassified Methylocaldum]MBP1151010.1 hypothetical protein [Methylocaldum sp. RMAD-M]MVF21675.1 hypothetical protein [Methylocaldum sp. BRCS4]
MSEENNPSKPAQGILDTLKSNPKALYAAIGAVLVIVLVLAMSGGGEEVQIKTTVSVGQQVTLDNPNGGGSHLTTMPGLISTSEAEEDQEQSVCVTKAGTKATVEEEMVVGQLPFVKVKVLDGDCQGKSGWTSKVNVKGS